MVLQLQFAPIIPFNNSKYQYIPPTKSLVEDMQRPWLSMDVTGACLFWVALCLKSFPNLLHIAITIVSSSIHDKKKSKMRFYDLLN